MEYFFGGNLNHKEKIFKALALIPKGTVQAALGPLFLDNIRNSDDSIWIFLDKMDNEPEIDHLEIEDMWEGWGKDILTVSVLSILITAPLGAVLITSLGPKLLASEETSYESLDENRNKDSLNYN